MCVWIDGERKVGVARKRSTKGKGKGKERGMGVEAAPGDHGWPAAQGATATAVAASAATQQQATPPRPQHLPARPAPSRQWRNCGQLGAPSSSKLAVTGGLHGRRLRRMRPVVVQQWRRRLHRQQQRWTQCLRRRQLRPARRGRRCPWRCPCSRRSEPRHTAAAIGPHLRQQHQLAAQRRRRAPQRRQASTHLRHAPACA